MSAYTALLSLIPSWAYTMLGTVAFLISILRLLMHCGGHALPRQNRRHRRLLRPYYLSKTTALIYCASGISGLTALTLACNGHPSLFASLLAVITLGAATRLDMAGMVR